MFPVLEYSMMIVLCYLPYLLAEALALSGIVAILTAAVVMSHYTHGNLSPVTQACISLSHLSKNGDNSFVMQVCMAHLSRLLPLTSHRLRFDRAHKELRSNLKSLKSKLRRSVLQSAAFNSPLFARELERGLRVFWEAAHFNEQHMNVKAAAVRGGIQILTCESKTYELW